MGPHKLLLILSVMWILQLATTASSEKPQHGVNMINAVGGVQAASTPLNTYRFDLSKSTITRSSRVVAQPGKTGLTVKLSHSSAGESVHSVSPSPADTVKKVANTWQMLKVKPIP
jgi:hypothetical protein